MTAIVGLVHEGTVWLAGDRSVASGTALTPSTLPKVWRSGDVVVGCAGEYAWLLAWRAELPPRADHRGPGMSEVGRDGFEWLGDTVLPAVRKRLLDAGRVGRATDGTEQCDGTALVGYAGRLYEINAFTPVPCAEPVAGIGSGGNLVIGAMAGMLMVGRGSTPTRRLLRALGIAALYDAFVRPPFDVVHTEAPR